MKAAPHPSQTERLQSLEDYEILDTLPEKAFDDLVDLASRLTGAPVSLVSLVDKDRQWFKAMKDFDSRQTGLENSMCAHAILEGGVVEITDPGTDIRTADMPIVVDKDNPVRFYAGAPLTTPEGLPLGMLCVLDFTPRQLTDDQKFGLKVLSDQVMAQLNLRRQLKREETLRLELEASLSERDLLAREIDHRMKNSLAMVTGFLNLQKRRAANEAVKMELDAAARRVATIGQLHEELYSSADHGVIDLSVFAGRLTALLGRNAPPNVVFEVDLATIPMNAKRASAFAVVTNEFITNAFKHAFPDSRGGEIRIDGKIDGETYHLTLRDNGVGTSRQVSSADQDQGLGTRIIEMVGRQLDGTPVLTANEEGYRFNISFPIEPVSVSDI